VDKGDRIDGVIVAGYSPDGKDLSAREAEESPLLTSVTRKRLLKTLRTGKDLVFAAVICEVWRTAKAL
jgi:hypothetical protein